MAFVGDYTCSRCHNPRHEIVTRDRVCSHCRRDDAKAASKARRVYLAGLTGLTTEERLAKLEAQMYDLAETFKAHQWEHGWDIKY